MQMHSEIWASYSALHIWLNTCIFSNCLSQPNIMTNLTKFSKPDKISSLSPTPMALTCSKDLRGWVVKWCEEYGYSYKKLAELAGCSNGTISNILQYQQLYSQSTHPFSQHPGRTRIFYHTAFIYRLLQRQCSIHLDEVQAKFREDRRIRDLNRESTPGDCLSRHHPQINFLGGKGLKQFTEGCVGGQHGPVQQFRSFYFSWIYNLGIHWC